MGGGFPSGSYGGHLYLVCAVCKVTIWRHFHVSKPTFCDVFWHNMQNFYIHSPYFILSLHYKLSALQVRPSEKSKLNASTQLFITAKISGCALKQGYKTHSSMRHSNLQLQNEAAPMSCRIPAVEHRMRALDWLAHAPVCKITSCYITQELRMCIKYTSKLSIFCYL